MTSIKKYKDGDKHVMIDNCENCTVILYNAKNNDKMTIVSEDSNFIVVVKGTMHLNNSVLRANDFASLKNSNNIEIYTDCTFLHILVDSQRNDNTFSSYHLNEHKQLFKKGIFKIVPTHVLKQFGSGELYPLVGPMPISLGANYMHKGPDNFILILTKNKVGDGPLMHKHTLSTEIFIPLQGKYKVTVDDNIYELEPYDMIMIEKGRYRDFRALEDDSVLLPIVLGTNDESKDIIFPKSVEESFPGMRKNYLRLGKIFGLKIEK